MKKYGHAFIVQHPNFMCELSDGSVVRELTGRIGKRLREERGNGTIIVHNYSNDFIDVDEFDREAGIYDSYRLIKLDAEGVHLPQWRLSRRENMAYFLRHPRFKRAKIDGEYFRELYKSVPRAIRPDISEKEMVLVECWPETGFRAAAAAIRALLGKGATAEICGLYSNDQQTGCVDRMAAALARQGVATREIEGMKHDYLLDVFYPALPG
ncbi:MAG: hypothetical protein QXU82_00080 [Candidatus Aenigmatarchaeota archaeon]